MRKTMAERFWEKVARSEVDECWPWVAAIEKGYGKFNVDGTRMLPAHRIAYQLVVGPIPEGLELDHLCHTRDLSCLGGESCGHRRCVNPAHLEPVTHAENMKRGRSPIGYHAQATHCVHGHEFTPENTNQQGTRRRCRACNRDRCRRYYAARKAAA